MKKTLTVLNTFILPLSVLSLLLFYINSIHALSESATLHNEPSKNQVQSAQASIHQFANQCHAIHMTDSSLRLIKNDEAYHFSSSESLGSKAVNEASQFTLRPSALGIYLLFDQDEQFMIAENHKLVAVNQLSSEMTLDLPETNTLVSPAEWELQSTSKNNSFHLKNIKSQLWLSEPGLSSKVNEAAHITLKASKDCLPFPESETGANGTISKTQHDNGMLWGFVDAHEHIGANHGFGGQVFHGASFHKLGVEHALADCEKHHGVKGSKDLMDLSYQSNSGDITPTQLLKNIFNHLVMGAPNHESAGYPELTNWAIHEASTHQSLYYKWIERSYLGGMRLLVEYMESTEVVCDTNQLLFFSRNSHVDDCNEMVHIDHQLKKMQEMQDYIDAQAGGRGLGWFRLVYSPEEARRVIQEGKLAVILGIEIENPLNCFIDDREGFAPCTDADVRERLNNYYDKGVRALFPSHKFVNAFSSGDGDPGILELGDHSNTGKWRDYIACKDVAGDFYGNHGEGKKKSLFAGLGDIPGLDKLNNFLSGDDAGTYNQTLPIYPDADIHCQRNGFTSLGLSLIDEMMSLGMIIDLGHTPRSGLNDIVPILKKHNYPAVNTHGGDQNLIQAINILSTKGLGSVCRDANGTTEIQAKFQQMVDQINPETQLPRNGLSYDFNGFAQYTKPRFGELSDCETEQKEPLTYPFTSFAGDITFNKLQTGSRSYDFNTDGLANIGLLPDLIEEARRAGVSDEAVTLLFKTAEAYIQLWERAKSKGK